MVDRQVTSPAVNAARGNHDQVEMATDVLPNLEPISVNEAALPPLPPPAASPVVRQAEQRSAQVDALRAFLDAGGDPLPTTFKNKGTAGAEAAPVIVFGLGSSVLLSGYVELLHLNGLRGIVTRIGDGDMYDLQLSDGTTLRQVPAARLHPGVSDQHSATTKAEPEEYVPFGSAGNSAIDRVKDQARMIRETLEGQYRSRS